MSKATQSNALSVIKDKWLDDPDKDQGIKTQFKTVNLKLGSLRGFVCLQAIPKVGKSTLAMQVGVHVAQNGTPVYYIDFENGKVEVMKRVCQQLYEYEPHELKAKLKKTTLDKWADDNFLIYDISDIRRPEDLVSIVSEGVCFIIIDSLQRLPSLRESPRESINVWLSTINEISRDDKCTVLAISELNRQNYKQKNSIAGGKESGEIEYLADTTLKLNTTKDSGIYSLDVVLSRHSSTGKIGRFGLTKYRKFVENPDPEEFNKIKFEDGKNEISEILEAIDMLDKESTDGRVYMDELAKILDMSVVALGKFLNDEALSEMGFIKEKERRAKHEKKEKMFIKRIIIKSGDGST